MCDIILVRTLTIPEVCRYPKNGGDVKMDAQAIIQEIADLLNERHEGYLSVDNPTAVQVDDAGKPTGHIYALSVTATFVNRINRAIVENVIALVLVRHGVIVFRYDECYVIAQKKANLLSDYTFHLLYCNDGIITDTPCSTLVFADECCGSFHIREDDAHFFIKQRDEFTEVVPLTESNIILPDPIHREEVWGG